MKESTINKLYNDLKNIKESGQSIRNYLRSIGKDENNISCRINQFKNNSENISNHPEILDIYNELKESSGNPEVNINRDEDGIITSYSVYYPAKNSRSLSATLTRQETEEIFGLYTYYGGNITARQLTTEFSKFTLSDIKKIFKCFNLYKDSIFAPPHIMEELTQEELTQYRMNLKEKAAFKYCDAKQERDFTSQIKKMASEINKLRDTKELVKSLLSNPIEYEKIKKQSIISNNKVGIVCLSDLHVGAFNQSEGYIDLPEYNEEEINRRLDKIVEELSHKDWKEVIILNLGDNVDSYRKMTSSMTHQLPCINTDKEIAQLYLRVMMRFFNQITGIFNNVYYYSIGSGNHSSSWGWLLDIALSQQASNLGIDCYVSNNEIDSFDVNNTSFIYLHGKTPQEKGQFKGFPLNLDQKTQCWFNDFFSDTDLKLQRKKVILKGDLHQYSLNSVSSFDYINCASIYGSSTYIVSNFGNTPWGCTYLEVDDNGNYVVGTIRE